MTILNRFRSNKNVRPKFFVFFIFSTYDLHFLKKWLFVKRNSVMEHFFEIKIFILEYVCDHSESILIIKKFRPNFYLSHFVNISRHFFEKWLCPPRIAILGLFRNQDFQFKLCFGLFWIDSDQKQIRPKFLSLPIFRPMTPIFWKHAYFFRKN